MSDKTMKIVLSVLTVILLALIAFLFVSKGSVKTNLNKAALRIGELRQYRTMNRADVNNYMENAFARVGMMLYP